ncbi:RNA-binding cell elongation regulator Jag/EloR [Paucilactobacillus sp. N302-9]
MPLFTGETIAQAIENGLKTLHLTRDEANIEVISSPKKGLLGLNKKEAEVEVTSILPQHSGGALLHPELLDKIHHDKDELNNLGSVETDSVLEDDEQAGLSDLQRRQRHEQNVKKIQIAGEQLEAYLGDILTVMGIDTTLEVTTNDHAIDINLKTDTQGLVIGHHGRVINALQEMALVFLNQHGFQHVRVTLDSDGYREKRQEIVSNLAKQTAREVIASHQAVYLDPMPAQERKQIHNILADNKFVRTYSKGQEPKRSIVIAPASEI